MSCAVVAKKMEALSFQVGQSIMKVISLRGSNHVEVMDAEARKYLALFPSKFQKSIWIRRGCFVVVDTSAMEKALESGSEVHVLRGFKLFKNLQAGGVSHKLQSLVFQVVHA